MNYIKVFEPLKIGSLELKNRFIMGPMETNYPPTDGTVNERLINYYAERAKGNIGLIITDGAYAHISGKCMITQTGMDREELIENHKMLTDRIHELGGKIAIQLSHAGRQGSSQISGFELMAPSPIMCPVTGEPPRKMTKEDIEEIKEAFAMASLRAKKAGYDAVELHGANGYLLNQFASPRTNKRTDEYGGNTENRTRFAVEIIKKIKEYCGSDYPVMYKLCTDEFLEDGINIEEACKIANILVDAGIDSLTLAGGIYESIAMAIPPAAVEKGIYINNAGIIKERINSKIPIIAVGRIKEPKMAEEILLERKADAICMARPFLADADFIKKIEQGKENTIRKCIACNQGCVDRLFAGQNVRCILNAQTGFEKELDLSKKADEAKKVLVVGGGPAGLEAARVAAIRGHEVILYDSREKLGGQMALAAVPPSKDEINEFIEYQVNEVTSLGVEIKLEEMVNYNTIDEIKPDVVILATGSNSIVPNIPGVDMKHVVTADDVLMEKVKLGEEVLVVGGGLVGAEVSEYLAEKGSNVSIVEMREEIAMDMGAFARYFLINNLNKLGVEFYCQSAVSKINESSVVIKRNDKEEAIENIDNVVLAVGYRANKQLEEALKNSQIEFYTIGDSVKARRILDAVHEGFETAYRL